MPWTSLRSQKEYYRNPRLDVLAHVPEGVKKVLDVGCGAGAFGLSMRSEFGAEVWGIEYVEEVGKLAEERLDKVFLGDCNIHLPTLPEGYFDLVTFNDVLEHLVDPWETLKMVKRVLAPGGKMLTSLPNIRYWEEFKHLMLEADFPYKDSGIFDRTHLRFFTEKSAKRFIGECGYKIVKFEGMHPTMSKKLRLLNLVTGNKFADCKYLQYIVVAEPLPG